LNPSRDTSFINGDSVFAAMFKIGRLDGVDPSTDPYGSSYGIVVACGIPIGDEAFVRSFVESKAEMALEQIQKEDFRDAPLCPPAVGLAANIVLPPAQVGIPSSDLPRSLCRCRSPAIRRWSSGCCWSGHRLALAASEQLHDSTARSPCSPSQMRPSKTLSPSPSRFYRDAVQGSADVD